MHADFKKWLDKNPWFGKGNLIKTEEFLGIATAVRKKTNLKGLHFIELVEKIWEESNLKEYPNDGE